MDGKQLKNSILQWAIQGKLVPQNPKDEPAQKLLERIALSRHSERSEESSKESKKTSTSLRGAKATKQSKASPSRIYRENGVWYEQIGTAAPKDISDEIPFEIPENWAWCRLKDAFETSSGSTPLSSRIEYYKNGSINWVRTTDLNNGVLTECEKRITELAKKDYNLTIIPRESICIAMYGGRGTIGKYALIDCDTTINQSVCAIYPNGFCYPKYIFYYMQFYRPLWMQFAAGSRKDPNINQIIIKNCLIPLPPLAEQKRIVAKLEQVLPLAEEYGAAQEQLDKLNKELPEALKKSILLEAIQGKLVPQNPKDEPAQKLLEKIALSRHSERSEESSKCSKKASLRGAKATKQSKDSFSRIYHENGTWYEQIGSATPKDITDEIPFEIPETWAWCRMNTVCDIVRGGSPRPIQDYLTDSSDGYNWIKIGDTEKGGKYINSTKEKIKPEGLTKTRLIHKGDFLLTNSMSFGRPYISNIDGCIHDGWLALSILGEAFFPDYLYYLLSSQYAYKQFCGKVSGAVVKNLNIDKVEESLIPLPPLAEQKRIVAKLEQLFKVL
jgi:type I restriction enzyme S subunit